MKWFSTAHRLLRVRVQSAVNSEGRSCFTFEQQAYTQSLEQTSIGSPSDLLHAVKTTCQCGAVSRVKTDSSVSEPPGQLTLALVISETRRPAAFMYKTM